MRRQTQIRVGILVSDLNDFEILRSLDSNSHRENITRETWINRDTSFLSQKLFVFKQLRKNAKSLLGKCEQEHKVRNETHFSHRRKSRRNRNGWWALQGLNLGLSGYEPDALTD